MTDIRVDNQEGEMSRKFLRIQLGNDMSRLVKKTGIGDPKAEKLMAILENLEAIQMNLDQAAEYEREANRSCSIYFHEYDALVSENEKNEKTIFTPAGFLMSKIENFRHVNFEEAEGGLFITREMSRNDVLPEDTAMMRLVSEQSQAINEHFNGKGVSYNDDYMLPKDGMAPVTRKIAREMSFKRSVRAEFNLRLNRNDPILDMLLFLSQNKRSFFKKVFNEIYLNSKLNLFKVFAHENIASNNPEANVDSARFFGCLNIRNKFNYKRNMMHNALKNLKKAYERKLREPSDIRDLRYRDLVDAYQGRVPDISLATEVEQSTSQSKVKILVGAALSMGVYHDYRFVFVFERLDLDFYSPVFQKVFMMYETSLGKRVDLYETLLSKVSYIHSQGVHHCDLRPENFQYKITHVYQRFLIMKKDYRLVNFSLATEKSNFCKQGVLGYLSPENVWPIRLPPMAGHFLSYLGEFEQVSDLVNQNKMSLMGYGMFRDSIKSLHGVVLPAEYIDLRIFFDTATLPRPETYEEWIKLFKHLEPIFTELELHIEVPSIALEDEKQMMEASELLFNATRLDKNTKLLQNIRYSRAMINNAMINNKNESRGISVLPTGMPFSPRKKSVNNDFGMGRGSMVLANPELLRTMPKMPTHRRNKTQNGPIRAMNFKVADNNGNMVLLTEKIAQMNEVNKQKELNKQIYARRIALRKRMKVGVQIYNPAYLKVFQRDDVFALGVMLSEMETFLNHKSSKELYKNLTLEARNVNKSTVKIALYDTITRVFDLKKLTSSPQSHDLANVDVYFDTSSDAQISANQYSEETRIVSDPGEFQVILTRLRDLILKMVSFFPWDRPELSEALSEMRLIKQNLLELRGDDFMYEGEIQGMESEIDTALGGVLKHEYDLIEKSGNMLII